MGSNRSSAVQIGKAAQQTGLSVDTIRFYEKQHLVPSPNRTDAGYRLYAPAQIERLKFVGRAQTLGFSLQEIRELLLFESDQEQSCVHVRDRIEEKIVAVRQKIEDLKRLESRLKSAHRQCSNAIHTSCDAACPVLQSLQNRIEEKSE